MTSEERDSIIAQLTFVDGVNKSVFEKLTDEELAEEMKGRYEVND